MINVDLTPLKRIVSEFENLTVTLSEKYKSDWDDSVHASYSLYVKQVQERAREAKEICCKAEELVIETEKLNIEDLDKRAENLCREADTV